MTIDDFMELFPEFKGVKQNITNRAWAHYVLLAKMETGSGPISEHLIPWILAHKLALLYPVNAATITAKEDIQTDNLETTKYGREYKRMLKAHGDFFPDYV